MKLEKFVFKEKTWCKLLFIIPNRVNCYILKRSYEIVFLA